MRAVSCRAPASSTTKHLTSTFLCPALSRVATSPPSLYRHERAFSRARARAHSLYASFRANTTYIGSVFPGLGEMSSAAGGSNPPAKW